MFANEFEVFVFDTAARVECLHFMFELFPLVGGGAAVIVPLFLVGAFELPLDVSGFHEGDADFPFDAGFGFVGPFEICFQEGAPDGLVFRGAVSGYPEDDTEPNDDDGDEQKDETCLLCCNVNFGLPTHHNVGRGRDGYG